VRIAIGCMRRGYRAKLEVADFLRRSNHEVEDFGCDGTSTTFAYADLARSLTLALGRSAGGLAILVGRDGAGLCIAANKLRGLRAAVADDESTAAFVRERYECNVLCLGADRHGHRELNRIVTSFIAADVNAGRDARMVRELMQIEAHTDAHAAPVASPFAQSLNC
jgi:ribose 5-phosphate isomerase B